MRRESQLLRLKLLSIFVFFCLIPMLCIAIYSYLHIKKQLLSSTVSHLEAIAKIKSDQIDRFNKRVENDLETIQDSPYVKSILSRYHEYKGDQNSPQYLEFKKQITKHLKKYILKKDIDEIYIFCADRELIVSASTTDRADSLSYKEIAIEKGRIKTFFSDIYKGHEQNKSYLFVVSTPIFDDNNKLLGVIVAEVVADLFFEQIQDSAGLGESGETLLGKRFGNRILFLNPLRHDQNAALNRTALLNGNTATPMLQGANGHTGAGRAIDYRGVEVVAAWRFVSSMGWGMVAKIDTSEVLQPLEAVRNGIIITTVILLIFGVVASLQTAITLMGPVQNLEEQATHDHLTGLPNRLSLGELLEQAITKANLDDTLVGVLFLDLDGFKGVNDGHGHKIGDLLLKDVAQRLLACVRQSDTVARIGGDEFVVVLCGIKGVENISNIASQIIESLNKQFVITDNALNIGASVGISIFPHNATAAEELIKQADKAMYEAKKAGKNNYKFAKIANA